MLTKMQMPEIWHSRSAPKTDSTASACPCDYAPKGLSNGSCIETWVEIRNEGLSVKIFSSENSEMVPFCLDSRWTIGVAGAETILQRRIKPF